MKEKQRNWAELSIPGYAVEKQLGRSARSVLLLARQESLDRNVLVKVVPGSDSEAVKALRSEVELKVKLRHPAVTGPIDELKVGNNHIFVCELPGGAPLLEASVASRTGALNLLLQMFRLLSGLHATGVYVCALAPDDVRVLPGGDLRIANLENAVLKGSRPAPLKIRKAEEVLLAPEVLLGRIRASVRSDLYLFGSLFFRSVYGCYPYGEGNGKRILERMRRNKGPQIPRKRILLPAKAIEVLKSLVAYEPQDRPATAQEVVKKLGRLEEKGAKKAVTPSLFKRTGVPGLVATVVLGLVAGAAAFSIALFGMRGEIGSDPQPGSGRVQTAGKEEVTKEGESLDREPDSQEVKALKAFKRTQKRVETQATWRGKVAAWQSFLKDHSGSESAGRARKRIETIKEEAGRKAELRLKEIISESGRKPHELKERLNRFLSKEKHLGTGAAFKAKERLKALRVKRKREVKEAVSRAQELYMKGGFKEARSGLESALEKSGAAGRKRLQAELAALEKAEEKWRLEGGRWHSLERKAVSFVRRGKLSKAVNSLESAREQWERPDVKKSYNMLLRGCKLASRALAALLKSLKEIQGTQEKVLFSYNKEDKELSLRGSIHNVEGTEKWIEVRAEGLGKVLRLDPLELRLQSLLDLVVHNWKGSSEESCAEALACLLAVEGYEPKGMELASRFGKGSPAFERIGDFTDYWRSCRVKTAVQDACAEASRLYSDSEFQKAGAVLREMVKRYGESDAVKERWEAIEKLYCRAHAGKGRREGVSSLFSGRVESGSGRQFSVVSSYDNGKAALDWKPLSEGSTVKGASGEGLEITGRVGLRGTEELFSGSVRVEGCIEAAEGKPVPLRVELVGKKSSYSVLFALQLKEKLGVEGEESLRGARNAVLLKAGSGSSWSLVDRSPEAVFDPASGGMIIFSFADLPGRLEMVVQNERLSEIPKKVLERRVPEIKGKAAPGSVVIDTQGDTVLFFRLRVSGVRREGWMEEALTGEGKAELARLRS